MKISPGFFFRHYFSSLFIFIIESDENTDITEKNITGKNIEEEVTRTFKRLCAYIYYVFPRRNPPKTVILVKYY